MNRYREWTAAFNTENQENMKCIDESIGDCHILYLVKGDSKIFRNQGKWKRKNFDIMEIFSYDKRVIPYERAKFNLGLRGQILLIEE